jgi:hypothetical protein
MFQNPDKYPLSLALARFSCNLESVRKDIECVNGILKIRFKILRNPIEEHSKVSFSFYFFVFVFSTCQLVDIYLNFCAHLT